MSHLQFYSRRISSDGFDGHLGQIAAFGVGLLVLILGILKLTSMSLTEFQLFEGILLVMAVMLLCFVLGLLLPVVQAADRTKKEGTHHT